MACLRRDMLLASRLAMILLLRSEMSLRFADTSATSDWNQHTKSLRKQSGSGQGEKRRQKKKNLKLAGVAAAAALAVRWIAHVGIIIMIVNNASRLMAPCEGGEDWLESSGRALDMVMRDGLSN